MIGVGKVGELRDILVTEKQNAVFQHLPGEWQKVKHDPNGPMG